MASFLVADNLYFRVNFNYVDSCNAPNSSFINEVAFWRPEIMHWSSECNITRRFWNIFKWLPRIVDIAMEFGVAHDISRQASYLDNQGERGELGRKQRVNNISCKFLAYFNFRKTININ